MSEPDYKALSQGVSRDMSPEAIERRLKIAAELHALAHVLSKAKFIGKVEKADAADKPRGGEERRG